MKHHDDDLRSALDEAHIALGVIAAQENTGHDQGAYRLVGEALLSGTVALQGSRPTFPGSPIHGYVRGRARCRYCGLRAYKWRLDPLEGHTTSPSARRHLHCVGCGTVQGHPGPPEDRIERKA